MRTWPARLLTHVPSVEAERPVGGRAGREVVRCSAGPVGHLGGLRHRPGESAGPPPPSGPGPVVAYGSVPSSCPLLSRLGRLLAHRAGMISLVDRRRATQP